MTEPLQLNLRLAGAGTRVSYPLFAFVVHVAAQPCGRPCPVGPVCALRLTPPLAALPPRPPAAGHLPAAGRAAERRQHHRRKRQPLHVVLHVHGLRAGGAHSCPRDTMRTSQCVYAHARATGGGPALALPWYLSCSSPRNSFSTGLSLNIPLRNHTAARHSSRQAAQKTSVELIGNMPIEGVYFNLGATAPSCPAHIAHRARLCL